LSLRKRKNLNTLAKIPEMNYQTNTSRWKKRLGVSVALLIFFFLLFPATVSDTPFPLETIVITLIPLGWSLYALMTSCDRKEQIVAWIAFSFAVICVLVGFSGELIDAVR